jgi:hypothetical protein
MNDPRGGPGLAAVAWPIAPAARCPDGVLVIQRRDAVADAFTVAWQLTGAVHCNKFQ